MKKFLFWLFMFIGVMGFVSFILLIESLHWILLVFLSIGILGCLIAFHIYPEYIHKILTEKEVDFDACE